MRCENDPQLLLMAHGQIERAEAARLHLHMAFCPACRAAYHRHQAQQIELQNALTLPVSPLGLAHKVLGRSRSSSRSSTTLFGRPLSAVQAVILAAVLLTSGSAAAVYSAREYWLEYCSTPDLTQNHSMAGKPPVENCTSCHPSGVPSPKTEEGARWYQAWIDYEKSKPE